MKRHAQRRSTRPQSTAQAVRFALPLGAAVVLLTAGCASALAFTPEGDDARARRARARLAEVDQRREDNRPFDESTLPPIDASLVAAYADDVRTLSDDEMGGRWPGTGGIELAAAFIENRFRSLGLEPAYEDRTTYRQPLKLGQRARAVGGSLTADLGMSAPAVSAQFGGALSVLGHSGTGTLTAPLVFVGYSLPAGPNGYMGYAPSDDLKGKIALVLRFEPMDDEGDSRWADPGKWSYAASLDAKLTAAKRRNAAGIIVVEPPDASTDELIEFNESPSTWFDEVPVVMVSPEVGDRLVRAADEHGRSLADLAAIANNPEGMTAIDLPRIQPTVVATVDRSDLMTDNVGAILPGRGELAGEIIVVGAHYDHLGHGPKFSRTPERAGEIHNGADDNASGTAAVLQIARQLADHYASLPPDQPARTVLFMAFTAEESGLRGSRFYVDHPIAEIETHTLMLNLDMVGRLRDGHLELGGHHTADWLEALTAPGVERCGLRVRDLEIGWGRSDHASFDAAGVPALVMFTGLHDDYHTPDDQFELVNTDGGARIADLGASIMFAAATRPSSQTVEKIKPERTEPKVRLGLIPADNYGQPGVLVRRVFADTSAADAGLEQGDVLLSWNGDPLDDLSALSEKILHANPDDRVRLTIERAGEPGEMEIEMTLRGIE